MGKRLILIWLFLFSAAPVLAGATAKSIAFIGVDILSMTETSGVIRDQTVVVRNGRIAAVGPRGSVDVPPDAQVIDGSGKTLMPGLVDSHVHLEWFEKPDVLRLFLANGVTTVRNMDGRPYILEWKRKVVRGELAGPRIFTAGPILDGDPPVRNDNTIIRSPAEAAAAVNAQAEAGYDFIKLYTNVAPPAYSAALGAARARGLPVSGHKPRDVPLANVLNDFASLEHLGDFSETIEAADSPFRNRPHWSKRRLAHPLDAANLTTLARQISHSSAWIVPSLVQADRSLAPSAVVETWLAEPAMKQVATDMLGAWQGQMEGATSRVGTDEWPLVEQGRSNRRQVLHALHQAGAKLLVGTDTPNAFVVPGISIHEELANFVAAGLSPYQALAAATREPARFLGQLSEFGTVEAGKRADLLLLDANPLDDIANTRRIAGVMANGRWLTQ